MLKFCAFLFAAMDWLPCSDDKEREPSQMSVCMSRWQYLADLMYVTAKQIGKKIRQGEKEGAEHSQTFKVTYMLCIILWHFLMECHQYPCCFVHSVLMQHQYFSGVQIIMLLTLFPREAVV